MKSRGIQILRKLGDLSGSNLSSNNLSGCKSVHNLKVNQLEEILTSSSKNEKRTRRQKMSQAFIDAFGDFR